MIQRQASRVYSMTSHLAGGLTSLRPTVGDAQSVRGPDVVAKTKDVTAPVSPSRLDRAFTAMTADRNPMPPENSNPHRDYPPLMWSVLFYSAPYGLGAVIGNLLSSESSVSSFSALMFGAGMGALISVLNHGRRAISPASPIRLVEHSEELSPEVAREALWNSGLIGQALLYESAILASQIEGDPESVQSKLGLLNRFVAGAAHYLGIKPNVSEINKWRTSLIQASVYFSGLYLFQGFESYQALGHAMIGLYYGSLHYRYCFLSRRQHLPVGSKSSGELFYQVTALPYSLYLGGMATLPTIPVALCLLGDVALKLLVLSDLKKLDQPPEQLSVK